MWELTQGILWIDLGLRFGWGICNEEDRVTFGEISVGKFAGGQYGGRFPAFRGLLRPVFSRWAGRGILGYEVPQKFETRDATLSMFGMEASLLEMVAEHGWTIGLTLAPQSLKKRATGSGRSKKPAMIAAAAHRWGLVEADLGDNESDALNGLACMMADMGRVEAGPARRRAGGPELALPLWPDRLPGGPLDLIGEGM